MITGAALYNSPLYSFSSDTPMFDYLLALAFVLWNIIVPVHLEVFQTDLRTPAYAYTLSGECYIAIDQSRMLAYSQPQQQSIILHEYGHCLGLGHFGDCNSTPAIMGCATLGYVTEYDRVRLHMSIRGYVGGLASD